MAPPRTRHFCRANLTASSRAPARPSLPVAGGCGEDVERLGCAGPGVPHGLMVRSAVRNVEDLKGKPIAGEAPGSLPNLLVSASRDQHKIPAAEVRFANLGGDRDGLRAVV